MRSAPSSTSASNRRRGALLLGFYLFLAVYLVPVFPHGGSANELTRWATSASLVERGTFELSSTEPLVGWIVDTAKVGDRVYSNKAPAPALLGVPAYWIARLFVGPPDASNIRVSWTLMRWLVTSLPLFLLAIWMWRGGASPLVLGTLLFATPLFLYSLLLFSHVLAAVTVFSAYRLLFGNVDETSARDVLLAGLLSGLAVTSEFPAAIPVMVLGAGLLFIERPWSSRARLTGLFVLGGVPFALGLAFYNARVFGSAFSFSYAHESSAEWAQVAERGVFGIGWPTLDGIFTLLLSPSRGLFFYSPILLLSAAGLVRAAGPDRLRRRVRLAAVAAAALALTGHGAPHGGWAAGARYLVMVLPLLVEVLDERELPPLWTGLTFGVSFFLCIAPALTFPFAPPDFATPHNDFWRPLLVGEGWVTPTLGALAGLGSGLGAALPALVVLAFVPALVLASSSRKQVVGVGLVVSAGLVLAYAFAPGLDDEAGRVRRLSIAERYFRAEGRVSALRTRAGGPREPGELRRLASLDRMIADARGYAPDDWPYASSVPLVVGPTAREKRSLQLQKRGELEAAEAELRRGREELPGFSCDLTTDLAVVLYGAGRKDDALRELASAIPLVRGGSSPGCCRSLFLLGSLHLERGQTAEAREALQRYLEVTEGSGEPEVASTRQEATRALAALPPP